MKSFRNYTREVLPRLEYYRNASSIHGHISRPTLDELHGALEDNEGDERKVGVFFLNYIFERFISQFLSELSAIPAL